MNNLILVRHGQSQWNKEKRFTGWADIDLTEQGREEAKYAGKLIRELNFLLLSNLLTRDRVLVFIYVKINLSVFHLSMKIFFDIRNM